MTEEWDSRKRDRVELGDRAARCIIGENELPNAARLIAGRAYRGLQEARRQEFYRTYGKKLPWAALAEEKDRLGIGV